VDKQTGKTALAGGFPEQRSLHEYANEYTACVYVHSNKLNSWAICIDKQPCNPMYKIRAPKF
jgi:hypothetical protein